MKPLPWTTYFRQFLLIMVISLMVSCSIGELPATPPTSLPPLPTATPTLRPTPTTPPTDVPTEAPTLPPQPTANPLLALNDGSFSAGQITIGFSTRLIRGFEARIEEEYIVEQPGPEFCSPRHILLIPLGYPAPTNAFHTPQIRIYPIEGYVEVAPAAGEQVNLLRTFLEQRPVIDTGDQTLNFPLLPLFNAAQLFTTQGRYLDFVSGSGLRYLTQYGQALMPVNNSELIYVYQGLSADGTAYISAILPVTHPLLPADGSAPPGGTYGADWTTFYERFETYATDLSVALNAQPADAFTPALTFLDAMMASVTLNP